MKSDDLSKIVFVHIMKTGGSTLRKEFRRLYGSKSIVDMEYKRDKHSHGLFKLHKSEKYYPDKRYLKCDIIIGHFTMHKYEHLNRPFFTILRDPVSRVTSHYSKDRLWLPKKNKGVIPFETFCEKTSNMMTYMTGGDLSKFVFVGIFEHYQETLIRMGKLLGKEFNLKRLHNRTPKKYEMSKKQIAIIKKHNKQDMKLYEEGLKLFNV